MVKHTYIICTIAHLIHSTLRSDLKQRYRSDQIIYKK